MLEQLKHVLSKQHAGRIRIDFLLLVGESDLEIFVKIGGLLELDHQKEILSIEMKRDVHKSTDIIRVTSSLVFDSKPNKIINTIKAYLRCSTFIETEHFENFILFLMLVVFPSLTDAEKLNSPELSSVGVRIGYE